MRTGDKLRGLATFFAGRVLAFRHVTRGVGADRLPVALDAGRLDYRLRFGYLIDRGDLDHRLQGCDVHKDNRLGCGGRAVLRADSSVGLGHERRAG
jgi:hypothetical protein